MSSKNRVVNKFPFSPASIFLFFSLLFIRLPFFFRDYIDGDESTFILMGQSIADGYLPYDRIWDLKPPLLFYIFGLIEYIFPHSLLAIRFFGFVMIFSSAIFLIHIARIAGLKNGFLIALSYVLFSSMFGSVQGIMSEHVAVFFMLGGLLFFIKKKTSLNLLLAGCLFGCALLCKINYAYAIVAILVYHFISSRTSGFLYMIKNTSLVTIGIIISFVLIAIPFILNNKLTLFINSVFLAPFEYGQALHITIIEKLRKTWWMILVGLVVSFLAIRKGKKELHEMTWLCSLVVLTTIYTFFTIGDINGHYLLQVYPFISLLIIGVILPKEFRFRFSLLCVFVLLISIETMIEYYRLGNNYIKNGTLYNGKSFIAIKELKKRGLDTKKIFFANYHIGYWFLHQYPLTKSTTHPSNIARPYLFKYFGTTTNSSMQELEYLMEEIKPAIIVSKNREVNFFAEGSSEYLYFKKNMISYYTIVLEDTTNHIFIRQRNDDIGIQSTPLSNINE